MNTAATRPCTLVRIDRGGKASWPVWQELTIERSRAGLEVARQLGRKGRRKQQMTESKIKQPRSCSPAEFPQGTWPATSGSPCLPYTGGFLPPPIFSVLYCPFSDGTPFRPMQVSR
jgi:hypothetical protein